MANKSPMISRRWLINYVLLLLIIVFTYIGNRYEVQTGYQPKNRISTLKPQEIEKVSIQTADHTLRLSKVGGSWQIDAPILWVANNIAVERIINIINSETDSRLPGSEIDLSALGLQFPKAILKLNNTDFVFGDTNNIGERRYLLTEDTVFLLADRHLPFMMQGITGFVERRLMPRSIPLQSLDLGSFRLTQSDSQNWLSNNPDHSGVQISELINNWQTLEAKHLQNYNAQKTPRQKFIATLDNGGQIELHLMTITPDIVIARPDLGLQYHFDAQHYYGLVTIAKNETPTG
ncbi:MAG: DUF4340 domain-containing protein [Gammaproteobacteria bacterium]|nr:DUF4340 domain-containing protein [Gammaproteobacteria bacterium]